MSSVSERLEKAAQLAKATSEKHYKVLDGHDREFIDTDSGKPIPSVRNLQRQIKEKSEEIVGTLDECKKHCTSEADRAKSEADRAKQITGLDKVSEAIGLAAVPKADYDLPLVSTLRVEEGHGKHDQIDVSDKQDGSKRIDLPSKSVEFACASATTYIDKTGYFKTAKINEAVFERNGWRTERTATNLLTESEDFSKWNKLSSTVAAQTNDPVPGTAKYFRVTKNDATKGTFGVFLQSAVPTKWGSTASVWVRSPTIKNIHLGNNKVADKVAITPKWQRVSIPNKRKETGFTIYAIESGSQNDYIDIEMAQCEHGPLVTSYIKSAGAATTRAFTKLTSLADLNFDPNEDFTISLYVRSTPLEGTDDAIVCIPYGQQVVSVFLRGKLLRFTVGAHSNFIGFIPPSPAGRITAVKRGNALEIWMNGKKLGSAEKPLTARIERDSKTRTYIGWNGVPELPRSATGSAKSFGVWATALTEEQIQALGSV